LVRHKKGSINRAVMHRRPGDPKPSTLRDHMGKAYSWKQPLDDGHQPWALRPLVDHPTPAARSLHNALRNQWRRISSVVMALATRWQPETATSTNLANWRVSAIA
jgi:hypothetical protein